ncbi:MAG: serine hydrolase domain-containing protein [Gemmatimonadota bacterium]|jgi:CubicO group peptidase (beta-lactamase class C family)
MKNTRSWRSGLRNWARGAVLTSGLLCAALTFSLGEPCRLQAQQLQLAEARGTDDYAEPIAAAQALIREIMEDQDVPGASVAVGIGDEIVWSEGFGWADLELGVPVTTLTKFRIGSVSKTLTASALGILLERGQLDLDVPIQEYVPDFPEKRWPITTRQLGGHIAGIRHYRGRETFSSIRYPTVESGLEIFANDSLLFEPETDYSYSSYGWNLLSAVLEQASSREFLGFMADEVFEPLGLRHTVADHTDSIVAYRTSFYEQERGGGIVNAPYVDNSYKWAGGGFLSTPEDLVRFAQAHMQPGFLTAETLEILQTPQVLRNGESTGYGIGWRTYTQEDGDLMLGHSGGSVGGSTLMVMVPEHEIVVAGVVNISGPASAIVQQVAEIFEDYLEGG